MMKTKGTKGRPGRSKPAQRLARQRTARVKKSRTTSRQDIFVAEYLIDFNGAQAAIRAGYSPMNARYTAYALLNLPNIESKLAAAIEERMKRVHIEQDF